MSIIIPYIEEKLGVGKLVNAVDGKKDRCILYFTGQVFKSRIGPELAFLFWGLQEKSDEHN